MPSYKRAYKRRRKTYRRKKYNLYRRVKRLERSAELKNYNDITAYAAATVPILKLDLNSLLRGDGVDQRIGNSITMKYLYFKFFLYNTAAAADRDWETVAAAYAVISL